MLNAVCQPKVHVLYLRSLIYNIHPVGTFETRRAPAHYRVSRTTAMIESLNPFRTKRFFAQLACEKLIELYTQERQPRTRVSEAQLHCKLHDSLHRDNRCDLSRA